MKAGDIFLGVAIVAAGYLVFRAMSPAAAAPAPAPAPSSSSPGLLATLLGNKTVNNVGASLLSKLSVSLGGSSTW